MMNANAGRPTRLALPPRHAHAPSLDLPLVDHDHDGQPPEEEGNGHHHTVHDDPVLEELARLEQLRKSVKHNLSLRPIGNQLPLTLPPQSQRARQRSDSNASSRSSFSHNARMTSQFSSGLDSRLNESGNVSGSGTITSNPDEDFRDMDNDLARTFGHSQLAVRYCHAPSESPCKALSSRCRAS